MAAYDPLMDWCEIHDGDAGELVSVAMDDVETILAEICEEDWQFGHPSTQTMVALVDAGAPRALAALCYGGGVFGGELPDPGDHAGPVMLALGHVLLDLQEGLALDLSARVAVLEQLVRGEARFRGLPVDGLVALAATVAEVPGMPAIRALRDAVEQTATPEQIREIDALLEQDSTPVEARLIDAVYPHHPHMLSRVKLKEHEAGRAILAAPAELKIAIVIEVLRRISQTQYAQQVHVSRAITMALLRSKLPWNEEQLISMVKAMGEPVWATWALPFRSVLRTVANVVPDEEPSPALREALEGLIPVLADLSGSEVNNANMQLEKLLAEPPATGGVVLPFDGGDWGTGIRAWVAGRDADERKAWADYFAWAAEAAGRSKPTRGWEKKAPSILAPLAELMVEPLLAWIADAHLGPHPRGSEWHADYIRDLEPGDEDPGLSVADREVLRGMVWSAAFLHHAAVPPAISALVERCFRKIPDVGPRSAKVGNGALWALGHMADGAGVPFLSRLAGKVKYATGRRAIDKALDAAAARAGVSRLDVEEMCIPEFGLKTGVRRERLGEHVAELAIVGTRDAVLRWETPNGKSQKSIPKKVREAFPEEVKALKRELKELKEVLEGQVGRIERTWLCRVEPWTGRTFTERYLAHGLLGPLTRRLIWRVGEVAVCWADDALRDLQGAEVELGPETKVRLWHPMDATTDDVVAWRGRLDSLGISQPFKQAWREVYALTPAEEQTETYSNRFAAHLIRQHVFLSLTKARHWRYALMGPWGSRAPATRDLPAWDWSTEWFVEPVDDGGEHGNGYALLSTDQVRFRRAGGQERLLDVPAIVFSELMRDVDLFVSVCSLGQDPNWVEGAYAQYWDAASFGPLTQMASTRGEVLARLLPRLAIRDVAHVEERWLVVKGTRQTYKIHLGSGNIMMEDKGYLCIVPARWKREADGVKLPFEGDRVLSVILSKALLLAADDAITDPSILHQLKR